LLQYSEMIFKGARPELADQWSVMSGKPEEGQRLKEQIVEEASKGKFDHSPLLSTPHQVTCDRCRCTFSITYLDYLKKGRFRVGRFQAIEAENPLGAFLAIEEENVTPIILELVCERCGNKIEVRPLTVEYLRIIANRSEPSKMMYA